MRIVPRECIKRENSIGNNNYEQLAQLNSQIETKRSVGNNNYDQLAQLNSQTETKHIAIQPGINPLSNLQDNLLLF